MVSSIVYQDQSLNIFTSLSVIKLSFEKQSSNMVLKPILPIMESVFDNIQTEMLPNHAD